MTNVLKCVGLRVREAAKRVANLVKLTLRLVSGVVVLVYLLPLLVIGTVLYGLPRTFDILADMFTSFRDSPRKWSKGG